MSTPIHFNNEHGRTDPGPTCCMRDGGIDDSLRRIVVYSGVFECSIHALAAKELR